VTETQAAAAEIEVTLSQKDAASRTFAVSVSAARVRTVEVETTNAYRSRVKLPGFRKGHAPAEVVKRRFADAIRQSVIEDLLRESWKQARERESLKPVGEPHVHNLKFDEGAGLSFELVVDVKPELSLQRLGGFGLTRRARPVTDEMVEAQLLSLREQKAPWVPAQGKARTGDLVEATIANLDESAEAAGEPVRFVLGQGRALPDLEARIMELDPGGSWEGAVRFPDDHPDQAKRGATRRVRVALQEVKRQAVPELTDEFAREVGEFDGVAALREAVRADLAEEARREADARVRSELMDQIAAANNVSVPPSLLGRALRAYASGYGVPDEQLDRFAAEFRPVAEATVRRELILDAVAESERLEATPAEVEARLAEMARRRGESPSRVRAALEKSGRLRELERAITEEKVFAHLLALSTVVEA
jgi:trigger factor